MKIIMTDAQHAALGQAKKSIDHKKGRIVNILKRSHNGLTFVEVQRRYLFEHNEMLHKPTAVGRLSELAKEGIVFVSGKRTVDGRTLSVYHYEPDHFLRWLRAADRYADRLQPYVLSLLQNRAALLADTMEMVEQTPAPAGETGQG